MNGWGQAPCVSEHPVHWSDPWPLYQEQWLCPRHHQGLIGDTTRCSLQSFAPGPLAIWHQHQWHCRASRYPGRGDLMASSCHTHVQHHRVAPTSGMAPVWNQKETKVSGRPPQRSAHHWSTNSPPPATAELLICDQLCQLHQLLFRYKSPAPYGITFCILGERIFEFTHNFLCNYKHLCQN